MAEPHGPMHMTQVGPTAFEVTAPQWSVRIDVGPELGGTNSGPTPTQLLAISLAACKAITAQVWARNRKLELKGIEADIDYQYADPPRRVARLEVHLQNVLAQVPPDLHERLERALTACIVGRTLQEPPEVVEKIS